MNYYNEFDPYPAQWLTNLIEAGHLPFGQVDRRSIVEVSEDLSSFTQCHFFAGIGGWPQALELAGWPKDLPVWTGSCPCQPFSTASRGRTKGFDDERHLWPIWFDLIRQYLPPIVFGEQVVKPGWMDRVLYDLESIGYAVGSTVLCASLVGLPRRNRTWFVAVANRESQRHGAFHAKMACLSSPPSVVRTEEDWVRDLGAHSDGFPTRVGRVRAYGNSIVPQVAAEFIKAVIEAMQFTRRPA